MSDSDSQAEDIGELHEFTLVQFIHKGRKRKVEEMDIVPSKWLSYDKRRCKCVTQFLGPPYDDESLQLLHTLVRTKADVPESWPIFSVELKGRARTYAEGLQKLERLRVEDNVLTMESEDDSTSEVQQRLTNAVKRQKLLDQASQMNSKLVLVVESNEQPMKINKDSKKHTKNGEGSDLPGATLDVEAGAPVTESVGKKGTTTTTTTTKNACKSNTKLDSKKSSNVPEARSFKKKIDDEVPSTLQESNRTFDNDGSENEELLSAAGSALVSEKSQLVDVLSLETDTSINEVFDVSLIDLDNVECKSDFETVALMKLNQLSIEIAQIKIGQDGTSNFLLDKKVVGIASTNFEKKYRIKLPIDKIEDFMIFDDKLKSDKFLKNDVFIELRLNVDKDLVISKNIVKMLKKFLTKDVALQFTATRSSTDVTKKKFKITELCKMMDATITKLRKDKSLTTVPEDLVSCLSDVLSNARRWPA